MFVHVPIDPSISHKLGFSIQLQWITKFKFLNTVYAGLPNKSATNRLWAGCMPLLLGFPELPAEDQPAVNRIISLLDPLDQIKSKHPSQPQERCNDARKEIQSTSDACMPADKLVRKVINSCSTWLRYVDAQVCTTSWARPPQDCNR